MDIKSEVARLNNRVKVLNQQRAQNIGRKEALERQIATGISNYNKAYGTNITVDTLNSELERVYREKEEEIHKLSSIITAIDNGDFATANQLAGVQEDITGIDPDTLEQESVSEPVEKPDFSTVRVSNSKVGGIDESHEPVIQQNSEPIMNEPVLDTSSDQTSINGQKLPFNIPNPGATKGVFSRDFSAVQGDEDSIPLAPPPSFESILRGGR